MSNKTFYLMAFVVAALSSVFLSSCADNDSELSSQRPGNYHYTLDIPNTDEGMTMVLDSVSSSVKTVSICPTWATVSATDSVVNGHPVLRLTLKRSEPNTTNTADVDIYTENNDHITLTLNQAFGLKPNMNAENDYFLTNWEDLTTTKIFFNNQHQQVNLPWASSTVSALPNNVRKDVKKADGWEMAFSVMDNEGLSDCNYFGLYNRYLGTLRVFYYVTDATTTGSKYSFEVNMGTSDVAFKQPFYHSLAYAIPANHNTVQTKTNLLGNGISLPNTFKSFYTPYTSMSSTALSKGWTAFDIDMTAYNPSQSSWFTSGDAMSIWCKSELQQSITLSGTMSANISGMFSSAEQSASASGGVGSLLQTLGGMAGSVQNSALTAIEGAVTGNYLNTYFRYAGTILNVAGSVLDYLVDDPSQVVDSMPGKIQMSLTGELDLSGYISSLASNNVTPITQDVTNFKKYNSHIGQGVWSLADDPVIYVVNDRILGDISRMNLVVKGNGTYGNSSVPNYHLRMVSFFDPSSIKVNINPEIFPDASDVKVICDYGVYPDVSDGYTAKYASVMGLERPKLHIVESGSSDARYNSMNESNKTKYLYLPHTNFISKEMQESEDSCSVVCQKDGKIRFYGHNVNYGGKEFMLAPQVYFPYTVTDQATTLYDGEMPDFVVLVTVVFNSGGKRYIFSQRFLPKIVMIGSDKLKERYDALKDYTEKCKAGKAINYLQTKSSVGVKHVDGNGGVYKNLDILKAVMNYK